MSPATKTNEPSKNRGLSPITIAFAGNPNSGKTTLFNALTGLRYKVANYPGVTVEKKEAHLKLRDFGEVTFIDLPGTYNLEGTSIDEKIATDAILGRIAENEAPDILVSVVDASNLERNLYLTTQLIDLGVPLIVALTMNDIAEARGISIKRELLSKALDLPIVRVDSKRGEEGVKDLVSEIKKLAASPKISSKKLAWVPKNSPHKGIASILSESPAEASSLSEESIDYFSFEATARYQYINEIFKRCVSVTHPDKKSLADKIDSLTTHKIWGSLIFLIIMGSIFQAIFLWAKIPMDLIDGTISLLGDTARDLIPPGKVQSLIADGVIAGVGSVIMFVPQIALLFFFLSLLEDSGYLARAAFLMDRLMRRVGLQGRSFIPLLSSFACAIPGILSTRTIPSFADRLATILVAPLMSCSARLPVYTLLIAAAVPSIYVGYIFSLQALVLLSMYLLGVFGAAGVAWILKRSLLRGESAIFVMEMPTLRLPSLLYAGREAYDRVVIFIKNAGTVIFTCAVVLWVLASYPGDSIHESFAGYIGQLIQPVIKPLGFNWEIGVSILASFAAREVFVTSLSTVYSLEATNDASSSLIDLLHNKSLDGSFSLATALSLMVFYVFCCQCFSTLAVCRRETGTWKWPIFMFVYMTSLAYVGAFITYRIAVSY